MPTKVTITVEPSSEHPGVFEVKDAMQQVLDFFELLASDAPNEPFRWNLVSASMNSPFSAVAEAVSLDPEVDVTPIARSRILDANEFLSEIAAGNRPRIPVSRRRREIARRLLRRNTDGVGRTRAEFSVDPKRPLTLTPRVAEAALHVLETIDENAFDLLAGRKSRIEIGSVEGQLIDVGTDYNVPAIYICERKSGRRITCRVDDAMREEIASAAGFADVWDHRRVVVRGKIQYDDGGVITRVWARSVSPLHPRKMTLHDIEDRGFTEGLDTLTYLERLREGDLG